MSDQTERSELTQLFNITSVESFTVGFLFGALFVLSIASFFV